MYTRLLRDLGPNGCGCKWCAGEKLGSCAAFGSGAGPAGAGPMFAAPV